MLVTKDGFEYQLKVHNFVPYIDLDKLQAVIENNKKTLEQKAVEMQLKDNETEIEEEASLDDEFDHITIDNLLNCNTIPTVPEMIAMYERAEHLTMMPTIHLKQSQTEANTTDDPTTYITKDNQRQNH